MEEVFSVACYSPRPEIIEEAGVTVSNGRNIYKLLSRVNSRKDLYTPYYFPPATNTQTDCFGFIYAVHNLIVKPASLPFHLTAHSGINI